MDTSKTVELVRAIDKLERAAEGARVSHAALEEACRYAAAQLCRAWAGSGRGSATILSAQADRVWRFEALEIGGVSLITGLPNGHRGWGPACDSPTRADCIALAHTLVALHAAVIGWLEAGARDNTAALSVLAAASV